MADLDEKDLPGPAGPSVEDEAKGVSSFDPFRDEAAKEEGINSKNYIHVRVQQRNGRKSLTTVQGLDAQLSYKKVLKAFKKAFCCNGTVVDDQELGQVIQLQGDHRQDVFNFLQKEGIAKKDMIKVHGF